MKLARNIVIIFSLLLSLPVKAQVGQHRQDFSIGGSAGYTLNRVDFTPSIKQFYKGAPTFGFTSRYICEKYFNSICGVQLEVNYQNLGWKENIEDIYSLDADGEKVYSVKDNKYTRDVHCIEIPVLMQMGWGRERRGFKFVFEAGPYLQYLFASKESMSGDPWNTKNSAGESIRPGKVDKQYGMNIDHRFCYGIQAGAGVEFSSVIGHFILDGRYCYGLGDMFDNTKKGTFGRSANMTIEAKLTYLFDLVRTKGDNIK